MQWICSATVASVKAMRKAAALHRGLPLRRMTPGQAGVQRHAATAPWLDARIGPLGAGRF